MEQEWYDFDKTGEWVEPFLEGQQIVVIEP